MKKFNAPLSSLTAVVCAFAVSFGSTASQANARLGRLPKENVARQELHFFKGGSVSLSTMRGQVVVLDFFASWCGHSRLHVPALKRLSEEEASRGAKIIGLAVEEREATVLQFMRDHQIGYPVTSVTDPVFGGFVESRDVSVPQTLVYGRDGRLAGHFIGHSAELDTELIATVKRELDKQ